MRRNCSRQEAERRRGWDRLEAAAAAAAAAAANGGATDSTSSGIVTTADSGSTRGVCTHPG